MSRLKFYILLFCFFLSGLAGLIYQVAWTKSLGLVFGHTVYAIATVLAAFMGGLAAGSALIGRWGERHSRPLVLYGRMELLIGAILGEHCGSINRSADRGLLAASEDRLTADGAICRVVECFGWPHSARSCAQNIGPAGCRED